MSEFMTEEMKRFNYLAGEIDAAYHEAALKLGLSDSAMMVLYTICNRGEECLLHDIIRLSGLSKQTVNSALRKLEKDDVVYLKTVGGKMKMVCLTGRGKTLVRITVLRVVDIENEIMASWPEEELKIYLRLTQEYLSAFKEKIKEL